MDDDPQYAAARKLIDELAEQLLALNEGKSIPPHWAIYLKKAIGHKGGKSGRKFVLPKVRQSVKAIVMAGDKVTKKRTKYHNPADHKDHIATETGTSRKTVERRTDDISAYLAGDSALLPDHREAILEGISDALAEQLLSEVKIEERQRRLK